MAVTHGDTPMPVTMTIDAQEERDTAEAMLKAVQAEADKQDSITGFVLVIMTRGSATATRNEAALAAALGVPGDAGEHSELGRFLRSGDPGDSVGGF